MKVISLFGGIECGLVALKRLGIDIEEYYSSEIDPYAIKITTANHPEVVHIGSITDVKQPECNGMEKANSITTVQSNSEVLGVFQKPRGKNSGGIAYDGEKSPTITGSFEDNSKLVGSVKIGEINGGGQGNRIYSIEGKGASLGAAGGGAAGPSSNLIAGTDGYIYLWRKLTTIECERLQTLPDNYTACVSNSRRYKAIGNGWTVDTVAHIFSYLPGSKYSESPAEPTPE